jgi:aspartate racemase
MLDLWNATDTPYSDTACIHQLFEVQVERTPEVIAVQCEDTQLTYRELNRRANRLASLLRAFGVGPDVLVGLFVERSLDMLVGLLGILKAGGAYVPLDPTYPQERLAFLIQDARPALIVTQDQVRTRLPEQTQALLCLDTLDLETTTQDDDVNIDSGVSSEHLVYVIYTSGSTGTPKGILTQHRSLVNYAEYARQCYEIGPGERVLQFASINFDASAEEIYPCLTSGATLVLRTSTMLNSVAHFLHCCEQWKLTHLDLPTAYWHELTLALVEEQRSLPASVRVVLIGGERALPERLRAWQQVVGDRVRLLNTYGPTETTVVVTVADITHALEDDAPLSEVSIGRPIANTHIYLLDADRHPVPIGTPGEMYVGGAGLARGYLNRPTLTTERFVFYPASDSPGERLYRTGDLARYLPNGEIEFLGRVDTQVKIRGFRIELEEIEAVLRQHPAIRDAVVLAREDTPGEKQLVAYLITRQECRQRDLRRFLKDRLPEYMVPTAFVMLDSLPLTPNGKVDRRALPAPEWNRERDDEDFVAPTQLLHQQLATIWEELLHIHPIGIRDNFFSLGGHSLLAARMVARVEQVCGRKLALTTIFAGPTIEQLADALHQDEGTRPLTPVVAVQVGEPEQKRPFFFLHGDPTGGAFYCFPLARHLGAEQPFYVLEPYRFLGLPTLPSLEEIAAAHIEALQAVQPEGPYLLGGWCDGGLVAYEMARQLQARGEQLDLLVLMDPGTASRVGKLLHDGIQWLGTRIHASRTTEIAWYLRLQHMYDCVRLIRYRKARQEVLEQAASQAQVLFERTGKKTAGTLLRWFLPTRETLFQNYRDLFNWIISEYPIGSYPGTITIFWAREEPFHGTWRSKVQHENNIDFHLIPGAHMTCRTEHLPALAGLLRSCIENAHTTK